MDNHEGDPKAAYCQDVNGSTNNRNTLVEVASASARNEGLAGTLPNNSGTVRLACAASSATVDSLPLKPISEDVPTPGPSLMKVLDGAQDNSSANIKANATAEGAEGKTPGLAESSPNGATRANVVSPAPEPAEAEIAMLPALQQCGTVADAHKRLYVAVAITYLAAPALPGLRKSMAFSKSDSGWFASLVPLGAIVGGLTGGRVLNTIGRRGALIVAALWFLTGWFCLAIGALKEVLFLGRVLTGVGTGTAALAVSVFISEISPPELRGFLNTGANLVLKSGIFFVYILGKFLNFWSLAIVCLIPAAIMTVALFWCHESPRWLLKKGHHQRASRALYFYGGPGAEAHLASLERVVSPGLDPAAAGGFTARDLTLPHIYRPTLCVLLAVTMQQMSAINAILAYAHDIFEEAGTTISADYAAITFSAIQARNAVLLGGELHH
ncbi:hypothetical protein HPB48_019877 [Haemaphysalis longicornis]|uniref:Major facilitator superfamily (MFS) profile domain-containing protein n=1 Tax=Haemaphysalis longicornis TaxID=44386 RepID=A0A9J6G029_HAELO|nr:hypothetical protein HPB48_019877 [Haemaphysalis longicornis]